MKSSLISQQLALELLTNICSDSNDGGEGDGWEDMEEGGEGDGESADTNAEMEMAPSSTSEPAPSQSFDMIGNAPILLQLV